MLNKKLTKEQEFQEVGYSFPYHYLDLKIYEYKLWHIEALANMYLIKNIFNQQHNQSILDAGCGDGRFCYEMKKSNISITGVDFSKQAIRFSKAFNPHGQFFVKDLKNLDFKQKFDYITLIETLEHFIPKDIPKILENLSKNLKKEGKLIITVPSINLPLQPKHYQHFSKESLKKTLEDYFDVVSIFGYSKMGWRRLFFTNLRRLVVLFSPLASKLKVFNVFSIFLAKYYQKYLLTGKPEECTGLIAICKKNNLKLN